MPQYYHPARQTGRTIRMVHQAIVEVKAGKRIVILTHSHMEQMRIRDMLYRMGHGELFYTNRLMVEVAKKKEDEERILARLTYSRGSSYEVYRDHQLIETQYADVLEELHRWDEENIGKDQPEEEYKPEMFGPFRLKSEREKDQP